MSQQELLTALVHALEASGTPYMLTGSLASGLQGQPRSTHDVDVVIEIDPDELDSLLRHFPEPRFYVSADAARQAARDRTMFNILDTQTGDKADMWLVRDDPFDRSRFARRLRDDIDGLELAVSAPEDTILMKLRWSRESGNSPRQFEDALRVYEVQRALIDEPYLDQWASHLGVNDLLETIRSQADPLV